MQNRYADVSDEVAASQEQLSEYIDWDATMAFRKHLGSLGFGIAEAMDTAQRFEIGWTNAKELMRRTSELNLPFGMVAGAGTDQLTEISSKDDLINGVCEQIEVIQGFGGIPIILPMVWLTQNKATPAEYVEVYKQIIDQSKGTLLIHWLGEMFMPALKGYFPGDSFLDVMAIDPSKVAGSKISLLDEAIEVDLRRKLLPNNQVIFTGDDWNFANLIAGESQEITGTRPFGNFDIAMGDFSHALLGILDGIATPASAALQLLKDGDVAQFKAIMKPCEAMSRILFESPTEHYKSGLAFLAWLNGLQGNRMLPFKAEDRRPADYYLRLVASAFEAGVVVPSVTSTERFVNWKSLAGV